MKKKGFFGFKRLAKKEDEVLAALYRTWRRADEKGFGEVTEQREPRFQSAQERYDYYASFFIDLVDDVRRIGGTDFSSDWLWFSDASAMCERLSQLFGASEDDGERIRRRSFAEQMCSLGGHCPVRSRLHADDVCRTHILWLTCERMHAERTLYGSSGAVTFSSVKADLAREADGELGSAGFAAVDYRNPLDGYLAFSLYRRLVLLG